VLRAWWSSVSSAWAVVARFSFGHSAKFTRIVAAGVWVAYYV
jgi:hypothetical protein